MGVCDTPRDLAGRGAAAGVDVRKGASAVLVKPPMKRNPADAAGRHAPGSPPRSRRCLFASPRCSPPRRSARSAAWPAGSPGRRGGGRDAGCWPGRACPGCGAITGRTRSSPGPAGTPMSWAWPSRGWWWRCWSRPGSRSRWRSMTPCSEGAAGLGGLLVPRRLSARTSEDGARQQLSDRGDHREAAGDPPASGDPAAGQAGHQVHHLVLPAVAGSPHGRAIAAALPGRAIHVVADSAYAGGELKKLPARVTWTTRLRKDAALFGLRRPGPAGAAGRLCGEGIRHHARLHLARGAVCQAGCRKAPKVMHTDLVRCRIAGG